MSCYDRILKEGVLERQSSTRSLERRCAIVDLAKLLGYLNDQRLVTKAMVEARKQQENGDRTTSQTGAAVHCL